MSHFYTPPPGDAFAAPQAPVPLPPFRMALEAHIERMIEMLDVVDGDPDLEPDDCDIEDNADLEPNGDELDDDREDEPSLASLNPHEDLSQEAWSRGNPGGSDFEPSAPAGDAYRRACIVLQNEVASARAASARLREIIARLSGPPSARRDGGDHFKPTRRKGF